MTRRHFCEDQESTELLAILMTVAKALDQVRGNAGLPLEQILMGMVEAHMELLSRAERLFPEPGDMQRSVVAFSQRLNLKLSLEHMPVHSHAIH